MNNTCPQCGSAYNIGPSLIGKNVTCKKCGSLMIVDATGLKLRSDTGSSAQTPAVGGSRAFTSVASAPLAPPPPPARRPAPRQPVYEPEDEVEADDDGYDQPPPREYRSRPRKRRSSGNPMMDFLTFRKMVMPIVVMVVFYIGVVVSILFAFFLFYQALTSRFIDPVYGILGAMAYALAVPLGLRLFAEIIIIIFRMYDELAAIREALERRR